MLLVFRYHLLSQPNQNKYQWSYREECLHLVTQYDRYLDKHLFKQQYKRIELIAK